MLWLEPSEPKASRPRGTAEFEGAPGAQAASGSGGSDAPNPLGGPERSSPVLSGSQHTLF